MIPSNPTIAIFTHTGAQMSAVLGLADLFQIANRFSGANGGAQISLVQIDQQQMETAAQDTFDAVILPPSLTGARGENAPKVYHWLRQQQASGALMCSVCAGAFWLAWAGILDGRPATTHWALEAEFQETFPQVALSCEALLVDDNDVVTAGGVMAWIDLGLFLVRRWQGEQVVSATARHLLVDTAGRQQANYRSFRPNLGHGDKAILRVQLWLESHVGDSFTQQYLAIRAGQSPRSFLRRFKSATGLTPTGYVQNLRVEKARGLLERTLTSIGEIGWQVGYHDPPAFGRVFKEITGLTAGEYRRRFGLR